MKWMNCIHPIRENVFNYRQQFSHWSMQLLVSRVFCLVVWFPSRDKAERTDPTTGWLKGTRPIGLNWVCKYSADSTNASSLCLCLLAFIHVWGPVPAWWCHSVSRIDSCWFIFSVLQSGGVFDSWGSLHWHGVIQLGRYNRSQTRGQRQRGFLICGRCGAAFLLLTACFFTLWCEKHDEWFVWRIWGQWRGGMQEKWHPSINQCHRGRLMMADREWGKMIKWYDAGFPSSYDSACNKQINFIFSTFLLCSQLHVGPAMTQNSLWPAATVTLVGVGSLNLRSVGNCKTSDRATQFDATWTNYCNIIFLTWKICISILI